MDVFRVSSRVCVLARVLIGVLLQRVETLYADSLERDHASPWLHMFVAHYIQVYRRNRHVELLHLAAAEVGCCNASLCVSTCT